MKKGLLLLFSLTLLFSFCCPVFADLVWEPMTEDAFYKTHTDSCTNVNFRYEAQAEVNVVVSPENGTVVKTIATGESFGICGMWGDHWAFLSDESGWINLENCERYYNEGDFYSENSAAFVKPAEKEKVTMEDDLIAWSFPGSGKYQKIFGLYDIGFVDATIVNKWTDADGRSWAQVDFIYQCDYCWVCLSDRFNTNLPITARKYANASFSDVLLKDATTAPAVTNAETKTKDSIFQQSYFRPAVLVLCVMLVSGGLIVFLSRKNKKANAAADTAGAAPIAEADSKDSDSVPAPDIVSKDTEVVSVPENAPADKETEPVNEENLPDNTAPFCQDENK